MAQQDEGFLTIFPWTGKWNIAQSPMILDPQDMTEAVNIEYNYDGTRRKRGGVVKLNQNPVIDTET